MPTFSLRNPFVFVFACCVYLAALLASFAVAAGGVIHANWNDEKLRCAIAEGNTQLVFDIVAHLCILTAFIGALLAGGIYLPLTWRWPWRWWEIRRGERLWSATGVGMAIGLFAAETLLPQLEAAPVVVPAIAGLVSAATFFRLDTTRPLRGCAWRNVAGWIISTPWLLLSGLGTLSWLGQVLGIG